MTISRTNLVLSPAFTTSADLTQWPGQTGLTLVTASYPASPTGFAARMTMTSTGAGRFYTATGTGGMPVTAGTVYTFSGYIFGSGATLVMEILWYNAAGTLLSISIGPNITPPASWSNQYSVTGTAPATAVFATIEFYWATSVMNQVNYISGAMLEAAAAPTTYFDGSTAATGNKAYAWTGTPNASTSTETISLPTTTVQAMTDAPCPRVGVTVDGLGAGNTVYNLWRTCDGARTVVRGARNRSTVDSDYVIDYEAPLGRPVSYDIEVVTGANYLAATFPDTATVTSSTWWIQDPLIPSSAIPLAVNHQDTTIPNLTAAAVKALAYAADINIIPILGSSQPVALMGTRQVASGVDFSMFTRAAEATTTLRNLIQQTPLLLVRTNGVRNDGVPGLAYFASAKPVEMPVTVAYGGTLTNWQLQGDLVAAPSLNVLIPIWTYGTVQALWATYQQAQTTLAAKTYLDVLKSPNGV